jgi:hypothetical protein
MIELDRTLGGDNFSFWKILGGGRTIQEAAGVRM